MAAEAGPQGLQAAGLDVSKIDASPVINNYGEVSDSTRRIFNSAARTDNKRFVLLDPFSAATSAQMGLVLLVIGALIYAFAPRNKQMDPK